MVEFENYSIKIESIGGLGANLVGKLLGEIGAGFYKLQAQSFAEYGSEKRGSPVKAYIRFSKNEIRVNTPITKPDLTAIFSMKLKGKENLLSGVCENSTVVVNSCLSPDETRNILKLYAGNLYVVDALGLAMKNKVRTNMILLGAIAKASGFIKPDALEWVINETIGKKYPDKLNENMKGVMAGYDNVKNKLFEPADFEYTEYTTIKRHWGYDNAPVGGTNIYIGNMATNDISGSREGYIPLFNAEKCINCGLCDTTCPDMSFQFVKAERGIKNLGIDYAHCKGCLRCVEVCPTEAITCDLEEKHNTEEMTVDNIHLINKDFIYTDTGSNSWMESVSETTNSEY